MKKQKTVLIGLSGGVDSSVAALILKEQGYRVIGAFMKNFSDTKNPLTGECNWIEERKMAQKIAAILKILFITLDFEKEYKKYVIAPMFKAYEKGLTPNPDISCNTIIKFPLLWKEAKKLGADYISTGHYARIKKIKRGYELLSGKDKSKDQSYFLSELTQNDLSHTLFPLGNYTKENVRKIAKKNKFPNWDKKSTSGICFVGKVNMKSFLENKIKSKTGDVIDSEGNVIGTHPGIAYFTIGQKVSPRLGIQINKGNKAQLRWYVAEKRKNNILVAAHEDHPILRKKNIAINSPHLINPNYNLDKLKTKARIRHLGDLLKGRIIKSKGKYLFILDKPIEGIAEGQYIVLYNKNKLLGSGQIRIR